MPNLTTNFSFNKPLVNDPTDQDLWGGYLNDNFDSLDTLVKTSRDSVKNNKTTTYTVLESDRNKTVLCSASGGAFTVTLIAAATAGDGYKVNIVKTDSSGNAVTIDGNGSETISGATTYALTGQGDAVSLVCDGSNWHIVGAKTTPSAVASATTTSEGIVELATSAEMQAGTDTSRALTVTAVKTALGFSKYYESSETSISADTTHTFTHSLGGTPIFFEVILRCKTTDLGFSVNDEVVIANNAVPANLNSGATAVKNTTQIKVAVAANLNYVSPTSWNSGSLNLANWRIVVRAWR